MPAFQDIIDEQLRLLHHKGYDQNALHSFTPHYQTREEMESLLAQCILYQGRPFDPLDQLRFDIRLTGFFSEDKDIIFYTLSYSFDAKKNTLSLEHVKGSMRNQSVDYNVFGNVLGNLPPAKKIYALLNHRLKDPRRPKNKVKPFFTAEQLLKIHGRAKEQYNWLHKKGYMPMQGDRTQEQFLDALKSEMLKASAYPEEDRHSFVIPRTAFYQGWNDLINIRFLFGTNPDMSLVWLVAIDGNLNGTKHQRVNDSRTPLPDVTAFVSELVNKERKQKARWIIDQTAYPSKSKLLHHGL